MERFEVYRLVSPEQTLWQKINRVKSIHLKKQSNDEGDLRFGAVISSYFEAEIYKSSSTIPISVGDKIMVYQRHDYNEAFEPIDTPQSEDIGQFVVSDVFDVSRSVYRFIAYDCLNDLDVDFSARLKELNDNGSFPMLMKDLLDEVASFSGVPYFFDPTWETNPPFAFRLTIGSFYSDNITCRDVISWFAELLGTYVYARYDNQQIIWGYYGNSRRTHFYADYHYIVTPTDQGTYYDPDRQIDLIPVFYKEDGLSVANYVTEQVDCVRLLASDGTVLGQYPSNITNPTNCYYVSGNPLLDASRNYSDSNLYLFIATTLKNNTALGNTGFINYKPGEVKFFTFRFPYDVGNSMLVEPTSGVRYRIPVMSVDITDSEIVVNAFGNKKYTTIPGAYNSTEQVATAMDIRLNNLEETATLSNIISSIGTDVTITYANIYKSGKVAQLQLQLKRSTAVTSSTATTTLCTLNTEYRPIAPAPATAANHPSNSAYINTDGKVQYYGSITANNTLYVYATYILA